MLEFGYDYEWIGILVKALRLYRKLYSNHKSQYVNIPDIPDIQTYSHES